MGGSAADEFPLLSALGLYAADIRGDGNCLFNALSDQIYGHQNEHAAIRARVITYMRDHADYYRQFIDVHPGGGIRRNPKRKTAAAYSSPAKWAPPSEAEIDRVFENHLQSMARGGTYGDNMEITAFSSAFDYDVKIYQRDFAYVVSGVGAAEEGSRPVAHIAYHMWEHYSSIRNLDGPHAGPPKVLPKVLTPEEELRQKEKLAQTPYVQPWQLETLSSMLPFLADRPTMKRALEAAKGNLNLAAANLLELEENGSTSSQRESSSIERDHDSDDDDMDQAPTKRQDRRLSRASRFRGPRDGEGRHMLSRLSALDGSQESFASWGSECSSAQDSSQHSVITLPTSIEDPLSTRKSDSVPTDPVPARPMPRLKLLPPKPPGLTQRIGKMQQRSAGPRVSARDRKEIKKLAQKAARKERHQTAANAVAAAQGAGGPHSPSRIGLSLRADGLTATPPVDTLRTLYI